MFLDKSVRLVGLQFSFSNRALIPTSVKRRSREMPEESRERKSRADGFILIQPTPLCSLTGFVDDLYRAEFQLVDAFYQERLDHICKGGNKTYFTARYVFSRNEFATPSEFFVGVREGVLVSLIDLAEKSFWRVRAFANPYFENGEVVLGQCVVNINMEVREPRFQNDGTHRVQWTRDVNGNKVGDAPVPFRAKADLMILGGSLGLFPKE